MRYEMSGSVGMDGGVSAVVGSQAWVVSLEETGGTRVPTFSSFSVPPASSVWDLPRQWEWLVEKEVDGRNLAQHPWSLFNPRTSHVGRGTMRDIRTTFCAFNPQSSRVPFFSSMPTSEALSSPPDGHLQANGRASPDTHGRSKITFTPWSGIHVYSPTKTTHTLLLNSPTRSLTHSLTHSLTYSPTRL